MEKNHWMIMVRWKKEDSMIVTVLEARTARAPANRDSEQHIKFIFRDTVD
jgi:hypothetical protein